MKTFGGWVTCVAVAALWGCGGGGDGSKTSADANENRHIADIGGPDDAAPPDAGPGGDARVADMGAEPDDGGVTGDAGPHPLATCDTVCARYARCGATDAVGGDLEACRSTCAAITGDRSAWFACVTDATCDTIRDCQPPAPPTLDCDALCATLDECGSDLPDPGCAALCMGAGNRRAAFLACGRSLPGGDCHVADFFSCLGRDVYAECGNECRAIAACNLGTESTCVRECIGRHATMDPLAQQRAGRRSDCVAAAADDCDALEACLQDGPAPLPAEGPFCQQWSACQLDFEADCDEVYQYILANVPNPADALRCTESLLQQGCPFNGVQDVVDQCLSGASANTTCADLCNAEQACGAIGANDVPQCNGQCASAFNADQPDRDLAARIQPQVDCLNGAADCDAFTACLHDASPEATCERHCGALANCRPDLDVAACRADCEAHFSFQRYRDWRTCVGGAANCGAVGACALAPPTPCAAYCDAAVNCNGGVPLAGCELDCDDATYADPSYALPIIACALTAPACDGNFDEHVLLNCYDTPEVGGQDCLGFCRAVGECQPGGDPAGLAACLQACAQGFQGDDGVRFGVAQACLAQPGVALECDAAVACVPEHAAADCPAFCGRLDACGAAPADCEAQCAADPLGRLRSLRAEGCVTAAGDDCGAVRACMGLDAPPPPPAPNQATFCNGWNGCGFDAETGLPCDQAFGFLSESGPDALQCAVQLFNPCTFSGFDIFDQCQGGGGPVGPDPVCTALCEAQDVCGRLDGPRADCVDACEGSGNADPDAIERLAPQRACSTAFSCGDLSTCLDTQSPAGICRQHCAALLGCGLTADADACAADCDAHFPRDRYEAWRQCVAAAGADCDAMAGCALAPALPCERMCQREADCGVLRGAPEACVAACDDGSVADLAGVARAVACVATAPVCQDPNGGPSVEDCVSGAMQGGLDCANYCLAVDDCSEDTGRTLTECMVQCAQGFGADDALRLRASRDCLVGLGEHPMCRPLRACLQDGAVECAADCAAVAACGVPDDGCAEACDAAPDAERSGCLAESARLHRGCAGVAACVGFEPPPADAACADLCAIRARCDADTDAFLCERACTPATPAVPVQAACAALAGCGGLDACLQLDGQIAAPCVDPCRRATACGAFPDENTCAAACTGRLRSRRAPASYIADVGACLQAAGAGGDACDAAAAAACFAVEVDDCDQYCQALDACGFGGDPGCVADCQAGVQQDPATAQEIACSLQALGGGRCDIDAWDACFGFVDFQ
jgi:hypothetical protein